MKRKVYAEVPPKVEYNLTPLGRAFLVQVMALCEWAQNHQDDLNATDGNRKKRQRKR